MATQVFRISGKLEEQLEEEAQKRGLSATTLAQLIIGQFVLELTEKKAYGKRRGRPPATTQQIEEAKG